MAIINPHSEFKFGGYSRAGVAPRQELLCPLLTRYYVSALTRYVSATLFRSEVYLFIKKIYCGLNVEVEYYFLLLLNVSGIRWT